MIELQLPMTMQVPVAPPGDAVAVYEEINAPFDAALVNDTRTSPLPASTPVSGGAPGNPAGVTLFEFPEYGPALTAFTARTRKV